MRPSVYQAKRDNLVANADSIEILILGNSQNTYAINPNLFTKSAYNLAFESQTIYFDRQLLEKYLPILPNLKYVFFCVNQHNLLNEHDKTRDFFYKYYYDITYNNECFWKEYCLRSIFAHRFKETWLLFWFDKHDKWVVKTTDNRGWSGRGVSNHDAIVSLLQSKIRADMFNNHLEKYGKDSVIINDLEFAINLLIEDGITPILITCPVFKLERDCLDPIIKNEIQRVSNYLANKYSILYLDFFDDDSFEIENYFDSDHLNDSGAEKLTLKLDSLIENQ
jgi:hypothetical protein